MNHLLRASSEGLAGRRVAVLVNDFGAVNIDASLIDSKTADAVALSNGCVCCQIGDDLTLALVRILEAPEPFDAIVVEASGVSDPWRIAQIARADPTLALEGVFVVVDASADRRAIGRPAARRHDRPAAAGRRSGAAEQGRSRRPVARSPRPGLRRGERRAYRHLRDDAGPPCR